MTKNNRHSWKFTLSMFKIKSTWSKYCLQIAKEIEELLSSSFQHDSWCIIALRIWSVMNFKRAIYLVLGEQTKTVSSTAWRGNKSQRLGLRKAQLEHVDKKNPKESKSNINYTFPRKDMIHTYYTVMFVWCIYVFNCV